METYRLTVYSTDWCPDCTRARRILKRAGVAYTEIDIDETPGAEDRMKSLNGGSGKVPTLILERPEEPTSALEILIEPSDADLKQWLKKEELGTRD